MPFSMQSRNHLSQDFDNNCKCNSVLQIGEHDVLWRTTQPDTTQLTAFTPNYNPLEMERKTLDCFQPSRLCRPDRGWGFEQHLREMLRTTEKNVSRHEASALCQQLALQREKYIQELCIFAPNALPEPPCDIVLELEKALYDLVHN
jgi:hypothetical protein